MKRKLIFSWMPAPLFAIIGYTISVVVVVLCLKYMTLIAAPIFIALIIAYLFNPVVDYFEKKFRIPRGISASLSMALILFVFFFLLMILFPYIVDEIKKAADRFPETVNQFSLKAKAVSVYITKNFSEFVGNFDLVTKFEQMVRGGLTSISNLLSDVFSNIYGILLTTLYFVFIPLVSFYFIKDSRQIQRSFFGLIPPRYTDHVIQKLEKMNNILSSFIRGQAIVVIILIVFYSIGLSLIGLPFSILIAVISGIGDFIPYFGTVIGFILSMLIGIAHFPTVEHLLLVALVFFVVKGSENWYFYPKIVGKEVGLHFLWVLLAIVLFGNLFGFWGLVVAIPSAAGFKMHMNDLIKYYKNSQYYKKE